jgi:pimeloyl-ACP methyl ester carboxylesterase
MAVVHKSVVLPGGIRLRYVQHGDGSGIPVLLLHGVTDSWRSFEGVLPHLPPSIRAFALSQRGHGDSDRPATGYGPRDFADDLAALMDAVELERAIVVGHSMSSSIAQRFALDYPERTLGLVLVGALCSWRGNPAIVDFWESVVSRLVDPVERGLARDFQESTLARPVPGAFLDTMVRQSLKVPARVWRAVFSAFIEDDFSTDLGKIEAPTLILWGDRDAFCPRSDQEMLATTIAGATLSVYAGAGHALHWEEPERFGADLVAWTRRLVACPAPA